MDRTPFAGLTRLLPDDPLTSDDAAFLQRNITTIDHFIAVGAKTHRHDAHTAVANPTTGPTVVAAASSGTIDPGVTGYFGITVMDVDGGETLLGPLGSASTPDPFPAPTAPPSAAAEYTGGNLRADTYYYGITLVDGVGGETTISPAKVVTRDPGYASGQVRITLLDVAVAQAPGAVGWAVYRSAAGGQWSFLASGSGPTYVDTGADCADCLREPPTYNTTRKTTRFQVTLPAALPSGATAIRLYGGSDPDLPDPALVGTYPVASAGAVVTLASMAFSIGTPPPVSTSVGGAGQVNPATDIATPVASAIPGSGGWAYAGSGWADPAVTLIAGAVDLEGAWVGSGASGAVIGTVPTGWRPRARYPLHGVSLGAPRTRFGVDVLTNGRIVLIESASGAVSISGRWRV